MITQQQRKELTLAAVDCEHQINADCIRLWRDPTKEGTALAQLMDRIEAKVRQYIEQGAQPGADVAPPFGNKRAAALALYRPPFKFRMGYIHDAGGHMVADQDGFGEGSKVFDSIAARVRGWGRIGYLPDAEALQDEVGAVIADALTAYWAAAPQPQQEQP